MEDSSSSYMKEYSEASHAVLFIYDLRFKIVTVYVFGMLSSLVIYLVLMTPIGLAFGSLATLAMSILDYKLHCRQTLFSFRAAKLEKKIHNVKPDESPKIYESSYTLYFENMWKFKKEFETASFEDVKKKWKKYFFWSRGWVYAIVGLMLIGMIVAYYIPMQDLLNSLF